MKMILINEDPDNIKTEVKVNTMTFGAKIKVSVMTFGGNMVSIKNDKTMETIAEMRAPEILFLGDEIHITGFVLEKNTYLSNRVYYSKTFVLKFK